MNFSRSRITKICMICMLALLPASIAAAQEATSEKVKALYILKLRPSIYLGESQHTPQTICYYERPGVEPNESVGQLLSKYAPEVSQKSGKPLEVKWFKAVRDFTGCDIFYIPANEDASLTSILTLLDASSTLTISAIPQFINKGGMIGFVVDDTNHVKMEANDKAMKEKKVRLDAQVLEIMQRVVQ